MSKIKIGWCEVDITPKKGQKIALAGQFFERITDVVESPITVTALAIDSGEDQAIFCSCDLIDIANNLNKLVKDKLSKTLPVSADKVIISATHTHTSYLYTRKRNFPDSFKYLETILPKDMAYQPLVSGEDAMDPDAALEFLAGSIEKAILQSWNNRKEGFYQFAFGRAAVGMNRRVCYDDGSAKMWGETNLANFEELEGGNDSGIELMFTFDKDRKISGVIANVACPSQVVEQRSFISSDYWGKVRENLRKHFGENIFVLGLCSAAGDQCPRDLIRWVEPETPIDDPNVKHLYPLERRADPSMYDVSGLKLVGKRISREIIDVYESLDLSKMKEEGLLKHKTIMLDLPLRKVTIKEYEEAVCKIDEFISKNRGRRVNFEDNAGLHIYSGVIERYHLQQTMDLFTEEIHIVRLDDAVFATNPFELFLNYGNRIRARSKAKQTFLIQLACGSSGYLPTEKAEKGSHYSAYVSGGSTGHQGGDLLVRKTLETINDMF
jgi:hypothetical protein